MKIKFIEIFPSRLIQSYLLLIIVQIALFFYLSIKTQSERNFIVLNFKIDTDSINELNYVANLYLKANDSIIAKITNDGTTVNSAIVIDKERENFFQTKKIIFDSYITKYLTEKSVSDVEKLFNLDEIEYRKLPDAEIKFLFEDINNTEIETIFYEIFFYDEFDELLLEIEKIIDSNEEIDYLYYHHSLNKKLIDETIDNLVNYLSSKDTIDDTFIEYKDEIILGKKILDYYSIDLIQNMSSLENSYEILLDLKKIPIKNIDLKYLYLLIIINLLLITFISFIRLLFLKKSNY